MFFSSSQDKGFRSPGRNLGSIKYHFFVKNHFRFFVSGLRDKIHFRPFFSNGKELKGKVFENDIPKYVDGSNMFHFVRHNFHWKESKILIFYFWFLFGIKFILASPIENRPEDALFAWNKVASSFINKYIDF